MTVTESTTPPIDGLGHAIVAFRLLYVACDSVKLTSSGWTVIVIELELEGEQL